MVTSYFLSGSYSLVGADSVRPRKTQPVWKTTESTLHLNGSFNHRRWYGRFPAGAKTSFSFVKEKEVLDSEKESYGCSHRVVRRHDWRVSLNDPRSPLRRCR